MNVDESVSYTETDVSGGDTSAQGATLDLSAMIDKVLKNPQILSAAAGVLSSLKEPSGEQKEEGSGGASEERENYKSEKNGEGSAISPEIISAMARKMPELIGILEPLTKMKGINAPHGEKTSPNSHGGKREALLCAVKPYLSKSRCDAIDYIIGFSRIADILKTLE